MSVPATPLTVAQLAQHLGAELEGDAALEIRGVASLTAAGPHDLSFLDDHKRVEQLAATKAGAVLLAPGYSGEVPCTALRIERPRLAFASAVRLFHPEVRPAPGVHPTAVVAASATLGSGVYVGPYVVVGERSSIGDGSVVHAHTVLYDDVRVGAHATLHSHVVLREGTRIGSKAVIQPGAILGAEGFGYAPNPDGTLAFVPHVGTVEIGDNVDIGANACIDRGALHATTVDDGTKIDNLAQIGHNCTIGKHCLICGQVGLAGSSKLEDHVVLGGQAGVSGHITVGKGARVGATSGVMNDLEGGKEYADSPARPIREAAAMYIAYTRLPQLLKQVKRLQKQVDDLTETGSPDA